MNNGYLRWLKKIILPAPNGKEYEFLITKLYFTSFNPLMEYPIEYYGIARYDDNRSGDGMYLRYIYSDTIENDSPCNMLEMLIALANRFDGCVGFNIKDTKDVRNHFWQMIDNLGLCLYDDCNYNEVDVDEILYIFKTRNYDFDGSGGLFPLKNPKKDQRKIEIWAQLQEYLVENEIE